MGIKRIKLLKALEKSKTLKEAGEKAGYSFKSRNIYRRNTRKHIIQYMHSDPEKIKERFEHLGKLAEKKEDLTNALRANEDLSRIGGLFVDRSEIKTQGILSIEQKSAIINLIKNLSKDDIDVSVDNV